MAKKKYYDEHGNQLRSRSEEPFYKKINFWLIVVLSVAIGAVGMYILSKDDEVAEEQSKEEVKKETDEEGVQTEPPNVNKNQKRILN